MSVITKPRDILAGALLQRGGWIEIIITSIPVTSTGTTDRTRLFFFIYREAVRRREESENADGQVMSLCLAR